LSGKRSTARAVPVPVALDGRRKALPQSRNSTCRSHLAIRRIATLTSSMACGSGCHLTSVSNRKGQGRMDDGLGKPKLSSRLPGH